MVEQVKADVKVIDPFWGRYIDLIKEKVLPYQWAALHDEVEGAVPSHAIKNFRIAAGEEDGEFQGFVFQDSDVAKWIEAVAYTLAERPDKALESSCDELIRLIGKAQQPDGYLNTYYTIKAPGKRWTNLRDNHELYVAGHFIEAAVAYYEVTGKTSLLDAMCKFADYIAQVFGSKQGQLQGYDGHQEIELALLKLYRVTNVERYLRLSQFFIEARGKQPHFFDKEAKNRGEKEGFWFNNSYRYSQSHIPVREQQTAVGHAVRAVYMYTAMTDLAMETRDESLAETCRTLWNNVVNRQMYVTAGVGSAEYGEAFSFDYDLPNDLAYTETCASIGLVFWAKKMLELEADSRYADVMERALYNGTISGMELDGTKFFYVNPLEVWPKAAHHRHDLKHVKPNRQPWFGCACCPPNIARLIAAIGSYIYSATERTGYVHLYIGSETSLDIGGQLVELVQRSHFPWKGDVHIDVNVEKNALFTLSFRVPGWARNYQITVNGEKVVARIEKGYASIEREWQSGDQIKLSFPMEVERIHAHPKARANAGKVALQYGPIVYCVEEVDNGGGIHRLAVKTSEAIEASYQENILYGVNILTGKALRLEDPVEEQLYVREEEIESYEVPFTAIPYYAWANRGEGEMAVWLRKV
ncbi:glycoside hydrolase family 127 protein [Shouchella patagoniensis]|uniref:glycoside hydrolase family 127 protein n=1 Tax=Shouchella patagoniensis TaxID=228576 RepID=UPI0009949FE1|nr:beta-L-arabinofuranosidase domain-containing protein [Shouchella patagoniensis]